MLVSRNVFHVVSALQSIVYSKDVRVKRHKKIGKKHLRDTKPHLYLSYSRTELLAILNARTMHGPRFSFFVENQSRRVEVYVSRCRQTAYSSFIKEEIPFLTAPSL